MISAEQNIITLLTKQQAQLDALLLLLEKELVVLASRDIAALDELTAQKIELLSQVQEIDQQIGQQSTLQDSLREPWFVEQVSELEQRLAQCKSQTQVNQQVLEQSQLTLDRLKNEILASQGKSGLTYTNKGKPAIENKGGGIKA
ncbi:hypothetical protein GCM10010919_18810 [Alishewanella longhuensis]|uniref:Flagellar biosynthesis protein FlgN n=1 Tax=Alishewanella longhuensis TaxID=1091037 RepID=A0ABQ3KZ36_9ALTE|nr:flagellar export chaperone FlgN [Alishewanella longhuensis]GHG69134.1 hypothetical protein GCM10010919_18810 [Alishewanella longhuensis]